MAHEYAQPPAEERRGNQERCRPALHAATADRRHRGLHAAGAGPDHRPPGVRHRRLLFRRLQVADPPRSAFGQGAEHHRARPHLPRQRDRAGHAPPVLDRPIPAQHRPAGRRTVSRPLGCTDQRTEADGGSGAGESALRKEEQHGDHQCRRQRGSRRAYMRAAGLLGHHQQQATQLPAAAHGRLLCTRRQGQLGVLPQHTEGQPRGHTGRVVLRPAHQPTSR